MELLDIVKELIKILLVYLVLLLQPTQTGLDLLLMELVVLIGETTNFL